MKWNLGWRLPENKRYKIYDEPVKRSAIWRQTNFEDDEDVMETMSDHRHRHRMVARSCPGPTGVCIVAVAK